MLVIDDKCSGFELATLLLKNNDNSITTDLLKKILKNCKQEPKFVFSALAAVKDEKAVKKLHMQSIVVNQVDSLLDTILQTLHPDWLLQHRERIARLLDTCLSESELLLQSYVLFRFAFYLSLLYNF